MIFVKVEVPNGRGEVPITMGEVPNGRGEVPITRGEVANGRGEVPITRGEVAKKGLRFSDSVVVK